MYWVLYLHICLCTKRVPSVPGGQDPLGLNIADGCELHFGCLELNMDHIEEDLVLLTAEPSLMPCETES